MSFQNIYEEYKKEICVYCQSKIGCNIIKTENGIKCINYIKNKNKVEASGFKDDNFKVPLAFIVVRRKINEKNNV